jgi:hypothetical protein
VVTQGIGSMLGDSNKNDFGLDDKKKEKFEPKN